jgi:hypothetical protein
MENDVTKKHAEIERATSNESTQESFHTEKHTEIESVVISIYVVNLRLVKLMTYKSAENPTPRFSGLVNQIGLSYRV